LNGLSSGWSSRRGLGGINQAAAGMPLVAIASPSPGLGAKTITACGPVAPTAAAIRSGPAWSLRKTSSMRRSAVDGGAAVESTFRSPTKIVVVWSVKFVSSRRCPWPWLKLFSDLRRHPVEDDEADDAEHDSKCHWQREQPRVAKDLKNCWRACRDHCVAELLNDAGERTD